MCIRDRFVTEEIYQSLPGSEGFLMKASWPTVCGLASAKTAESVGQLMELVRSIRLSLIHIFVSWAVIHIKNLGCLVFIPAQQHPHRQKEQIGAQP